VAIEQLIWWVDIVGTGVFAISGALLARRKQMDIIGYLFIGTITGVGGGTLRDLLLGQDIFWIQDPLYLFVTAAFSIATFVVTAKAHQLMRLLIWFDAVGLALFTVLGAQKTIELGAPYAVAILMGVMSATFGGIMRDVVCNDIPVMLRKEIYISASLCGAIVFVAGHHWWGPGLLVTLLAFTTALFARALGIIFKLQLPVRKSL
jgi:uncharacterized membrane protein YeiH